MDIFDSNIWLNGLTQTSLEAVSLIEEVLDGERSVAVSAYIYEEVNTALEYEFRSGGYIDQMQTEFANLTNSPQINGPLTRDVWNMDLKQVRSSDVAALIAQIIEIQPKDVPIVFLAWGHYESEPTIYTADEPFSNFDPTAYNLDKISIEFVRP